MTKAWKRRLAAVPKTAVIVVLGAVHTGYLTWKVLPVAVLASILWLLLYFVNETYDLQLEEGDTRLARWIVPAELLISLVTLVATVVDWRVGLLFLAMTLVQHCYCHPSFGRLKRYWITYVLFSGLLNPAARFLCGAFLTESKNTDWLLTGVALTVCLVIHLALAFKVRADLAPVDERHSYQTVPKRLVLAARPLQYLTPFGLPILHWIAQTAVAHGYLPGDIEIFALISFAFFTIGAWGVNDPYDVARIHSEPLLGPELVRNCWSGSFGTSDTAIACGLTPIILVILLVDGSLILFGKALHPPGITAALLVFAYLLYYRHSTLPSSDPAA